MNWYSLSLQIEAAKKMPDISYKDIANFLRSYGYEYSGSNGSHEKWTNPKTNYALTVVAEPHWKKNPKNKAEYVLKNMGVNVNDFARNWQNKKFRKNPQQFIGDAQPPARGVDQTI